MFSLGECIEGFAREASYFERANDGSVLTLDQIPKYRGTMMSMFSVMGEMGLASANFSESAILDYVDNPPLGYPAAMVTLGVLGIVASLIILFMVREPVKDHTEIWMSFPFLARLVQFG